MFEVAILARQSYVRLKNSIVKSSGRQPQNSPVSKQGVLTLYRPLSYGYCVENSMPLRDRPESSTTMANTRGMVTKSQNLPKCSFC